MDRIAPIDLLNFGNYSSLTFADVVGDPDNPGGLWGTWDGSGQSRARVRFGDPSFPLLTGPDLQEFRVLIRKSASGGNTTGWLMQLYQSGQFLADIAASVTVATDGEVVSGRWDASILATGSIQCDLRQTEGGNNPNGRGVEVGGYAWIAAVEGDDPRFTLAGEVADAAADAGRVVGQVSISGEVSTLTIRGKVTEQS